MGFLKKLRKRDDRYARIGKAKAAKRDARMARTLMLAQEAAKREAWELEGECLHDTQVIFLKALHDTFGFTAEKMLAVAKKVCEIGEEIKKHRDIASVQQLRDELRRETRFDLKVQDIEGGPELQIQKNAIDEISALYLFVLHAYHGFGKVRLQRMYDACAAIGSDVSHGRRTIEGMMGELFEEADLKVRMRRKKTA